MNRSFTLTILTLIALELGAVTLAFYSSKNFFRQPGIAPPAVTFTEGQTRARRGPEVVVLWSPQEQSPASQYQVIRRDLNNEGNVTVIATVGAGASSEDGGYFRISDREGTDGMFAYEVIDIGRTDGPQTVTSVALLI